MKWLVLAVICMLASFSFCQHLHLAEKYSLCLSGALSSIHILHSPDFLIRVAAMLQTRGTEDSS